MRQPGGYLSIVDPERAAVERDTFVCSHCNSIVVVQPKQDPAEMGGFCRCCMKHICKRDACHAQCLPFLKKIEAAEKQDEFRRRVFG